jgi:glycosyltransferase involved in cell wall biosynthesis
MKVSDLLPRRVPLLYAIDSVAGDAGTEKQLKEWICRLDPTRFRLHLCCLEETPAVEALSSYCTVLVLRGGPLLHPRTAASVWKLQNYLRVNRIQIVHSFMVKSAFLAAAAARLAGRPCVLTSCRNLGYWKQPQHAYIQSAINRLAHRVVANSEAARRYAVEVEKVPADKVDVLYNGVDLDHYAPGKGDPATAEALGVPRGATVVGCVANYRPVKNLQLFVRAAAQVAAAVPGVAFLLVGSGSELNELQRLANELGLGGRIFFSNGRGRVLDYLSRMSVGCLTSHSESFSNAILEYMAMGLPVVATDAGGNAELVQHGQTGFLVSTPEPQAFAAPIIALLRDEELRSSMGRRARELCRSRFDIRDAVRRLEQYYLALLS